MPAASSSPTVVLVWMHIGQKISTSKERGFLTLIKWKWYYMYIAYLFTYNYMYSWLWSCFVLWLQDCFHFCRLLTVILKMAIKRLKFITWKIYPLVTPLKAQQLSWMATGTDINTTETGNQSIGWKLNYFWLFEK